MSEDVKVEAQEQGVKEAQDTQVVEKKTQFRSAGLMRLLKSEMNFATK